MATAIKNGKALTETEAAALADAELATSPVAYKAARKKPDPPKKEAPEFETQIVQVKVTVVLGARRVGARENSFNETKEVMCLGVDDVDKWMKTRDGVLQLAFEEWPKMIRAAGIEV